jgi:hypothetical protein
MGAVTERELQLTAAATDPEGNVSEPDYGSICAVGREDIKPEAAKMPRIQTGGIIVNKEQIAIVNALSIYDFEKKGVQLYSVIFNNERNKFAEILWYVDGYFWKIKSVNNENIISESDKMFEKLEDCFTDALALLYI